MSQIKNLLWFLIAGTRGGESRARIIHSLKNRPLNAHQFAKNLRMDYKTVQHHLNVLEKNGMLSAIKKGEYGATYFLSASLEADYPLFEEIWGRFGNKPGKKI